MNSFCHINDLEDKAGRAITKYIEKSKYYQEYKETTSENVQEAIEKKK